MTDEDGPELVQPTVVPADMVGALLWTDEYGSVWLGEPGADGSTVVADIVDDGTQGGSGSLPIRWLPVDQRRTV